MIIFYCLNFFIIYFCILNSNDVFQKYDFFFIKLIFIQFYKNIISSRFLKNLENNIYINLVIIFNVNRDMI